jgi:hypothetical protein
MMKINSFGKSALLVLAMSATIQTTASEIPTKAIASAVSPSASSFKDPKVFLSAIVIVMWVHLHTKAKCEYSIELEADLDLLLSSYNLFDVESYKNIAYLFTKYVIGTPEKYSDELRTNTLEDGTIVELSGKKKTSFAFGVMGLFDKYVVNMLEKLGNVGANWEKTNKLVDLMQGKVATSSK